MCAATVLSLAACQGGGDQGADSTKEEGQVSQSGTESQNGAEDQSEAENVSEPAESGEITTLT